MVFIWGNRGESKHVGYLIDTCPQCGTAGPLSVFETRRRFTVYFIPTFSYSKKLFMACNMCQATWEVPDTEQGAIERSLIS